jgi:peptide/nickel transport system permease protein
MVAIIINFLLPRMMPGDPIAVIIDRLNMAGSNIVGSTELIEEYKRMFGLDKDLMTQFFNYFRELLRGNLGYSIAAFPQTVNVLIENSLPWTIGLLMTATLISWAIGTILGALAGWRVGKSKFSKLGGMMSTIVMCLRAIPFWLMAITLVFLLAYIFPIFPFSGGYSPGAMIGFNLGFIIDVILHATLPALSIILTSVGWWFLSMRSMITGLRGEDFITLAEAKGLSQRDIMWNYAFRNALIPQVTGLALSLGYTIGGSVITETLFAYPGLGWLLSFGISNLDYPIIQGVTLLIVLSTCTATLILDLVYTVIDPRVKYGAE